MKVSNGLKWGLIIAIFIGLSGLIFGGYATHENKPPIPEKVVSVDGEVLYTARDVSGGQAVFLKYGLMNYGSIFGHGAYLGPDFTAEYLHKVGEYAREYYAQSEYNVPYSQLTLEQAVAIDNKVVAEQKTNNYDEQTGVLTLTAGQTYAYKQIQAEYIERFNQGDPSLRIPENFMKDDVPNEDKVWLSESGEAKQLSDFFAWSAWAASANRPDKDYSYSNNWPPDDSVGNRPTESVITWSTVSLGLLFLMLGLVLWIWMAGNYRSESSDIKPDDLAKASAMPVTESQVKAGKYFLIVVGLFLAQTLLGALTAHYFVDEKFFGIEIQNILPFNITRTWHLQLAVFWVATAWLGTGIFIAPLLGKKEPKGQGLLVDILFWAVVIVAVGSLLGEWLGIQGYLGKFWYAFGTQGWEYIELGRVWQVLLLVGMLIWLFIVYRALKYKLQGEESKGSLTHLLLYSAIMIPVFYSYGLFYTPGTNFTVADFWRWFVVHLWVEGMFEFFTVSVIAHLFVTIGLVTERSATRAVYFTMILVFGSGLIGVGHHYYWTGAPEIWLALGAVFSALEVIPLTLLIFEAWDQYKQLKALGTKFEYKSAMMFLIATSLWNFVGAGVLGFLINLPIVSYYEHGTYLTPTHGHAAMMGVYGMLALGLLVFALRSITRPEAWDDRLVTRSFWLLNIGLILMLALNLVPVGFLQLAAGFTEGTWYARSFEFINSGIIQTLTWLRIIGDTVFIFGVVVLGIAVFKAVRNLKTPEGTAELTTAGHGKSAAVGR